jgi:hypothetical protein
LEVSIGTTAAPGTYFGSLTIVGGGQDKAQEPVATQNFLVLVVATFQSTINYINSAFVVGEIDNRGIVRSLIQKLAAAQLAAGQAREELLTAFKNEVVAQTGKHIDAAVAQRLLLDANALIDQNNL